MSRAYKVTSAASIYLHHEVVINIDEIHTNVFSIYKPRWRFFGSSNIPAFDGLTHCYKESSMSALISMTSWLTGETDSEHLKNLNEVLKQLVAYMNYVMPVA